MFSIPGQEEAETFEVGEGIVGYGLEEAASSYVLLPLCPIIKLSCCFGVFGPTFVTDQSIAFADDTPPPRLICCRQRLTRSISIETSFLSPNNPSLPPLTPTSSLAYAMLMEKGEAAEAWLGSSSFSNAKGDKDGPYE
ncbi:hypothetical protein D9758_000919 [Tetrapyrgos nigripes]|uniref:Uncharacterized protein n=1 Tax=Tetrapyrgos nigripes TaxID=182062 RepID=A0A8H5GZE6_9AGAR|nr:hypothetical protein D9758_000919 [Tetrapyrgos nigripes]